MWKVMYFKGGNWHTIKDCKTYQEALQYGLEYKQYEIYHNGKLVYRFRGGG